MTALGFDGHGPRTLVDFASVARRRTIYRHIRPRTPSFTSMATSAPTPSGGPMALVYDSPGPPSEVLSLRQLPPVEGKSLGPSDIIVEFMLVRRLPSGRWECRVKSNRTGICSDHAMHVSRYKPLHRPPSTPRTSTPSRASTPLHPGSPRRYRGTRVWAESWRRDPRCGASVEFLCINLSIMLPHQACRAPCGFPLSPLSVCPLFPHISHHTC